MSESGPIEPSNPNIEERKNVCVYFEHSKNCYWFPNNRGGWIQLRRQDLVRHLQKLGFSKHSQGGSPLNEIDEQIMHLQKENDIEFAGPLAGHKSASYEYDGKRILVTDSPRFVKPKSGDWPTIKKFLVGLLREIQLQYFFGWLKIALECLYSQKFRPGQTVALVGPRDCGKSLLQLIITKLIGGRSAKPYQFMTNRTSFNSDLFGAEHLMIDDEVPSTDPRARKNFGTMIKQITGIEKQWCHPKYCQPIILNPFWRLTISLNEEPDNLLVLPPIEESIIDKIILFKVQKRMMPMPTETYEERETFWEILVGELPAFADYILNWEIPSALKSHRYGITHFHHPEILSELTELEADEVLLQMIDSSIFKCSIVQKWEGSAENLKKTLIENGALTYQESNKLFYYSTACGHYLGKLLKKYPKRVSRTTIKGYPKWTLYPLDREGEG